MKMWIMQTYLLLALLFTIRFCASKPVKEPIGNEELQELQIYEAVQQSGDWISVQGTLIGTTKLERTGTLAFNIPNVIPSTADEVLVFVDAQWGDSRPDVASYVKIYTQEGSQRYEMYISLHTFAQSAWSANSDNMWFPMASTGQIFVQVTTPLKFNVLLSLYAIGYRK